MMTGAELTAVCKRIGMSVAEFAGHLGYSDRTARRWSLAAKVPGPVRAVALAWLQSHRHRIDYGPVAFIGAPVLFSTQS